MKIQEKLKEEKNKGLQLDKQIKEIKYEKEKRLNEMVKNY